MNKKFLPKSIWDFYHSLPAFWNKEGDWEVDEILSRGLNIYEDEKHFFVEAPVPGIPSDKVDISFDNGRLSIDGETEEEKKGRKYHKKSSSAFHYSFVVPSYLDDTKEPEATQKNGVLTIKFLKDGKGRSRIPIKSAD